MRGFQLETFAQWFCILPILTAPGWTGVRGGRGVAPFLARAAAANGVMFFIETTQPAKALVMAQILISPLTRMGDFLEIVKRPHET